MSYNTGPKIVTDGLVLCLDAADRNSYPGSGSTWYDLSGNGIHGTLNATYPPTFNNAYGGVFDFDGSNDVIQVPDVTGKTDFSNTNDYSICFWVKVNSTQAVANTRSIMEKWNQTVSYPYVFRYLTNGTLNANIYNGTTSNPSNSTSSISDTWVYTCYSVSWSNNNSKLYINANMEDSETLTLTGTIENNTPLYIGARSTILHCRMLFANLSIYNKALSANEVQQNYNATKGRFGL